MDPLSTELVAEFDQLHGRLRKVVRGLADEALDRAPAQGENSMAVLVTHVLGSELGWLHRAAGIPFKRDRDAEFRAKASAGDLTAKIDATEPQMRDLIAKSDAAGFTALRKFDNGQERTVGYCVLHALSHTAEHVGHAELTRNLLGYRPT